MGVQEMAAMGVVLLDTSSVGLRSWYRDRGSFRPIVASTARTKDFFISVNLIIVTLTRCTIQFGTWTL